MYFPENRKLLFKKLWKILRNANQVYTTVKKSILEGSGNVHPQKKRIFKGKKNEKFKSENFVEEGKNNL